MTKWRRLLPHPSLKALRAAAVAAGVALIAGCGSSSSAGTGSGAGSGGGPARPTIGSVVPTLQNPFWQRYVTFEKQAASQLGFNLTVVDGQNSGSTMLSGAENLLAKGVNGLVYVNYFDTGKAVLKAAQRDGIPVAVADTSIPGVEPQSAGYENYKVFVGPSDETAGYEQARALFAAAKPGANGKINVFGLQGTLGTSVNTGRLDGFKKAVAENPKVDLVGTQSADFLRAQALNVTTNALQANPNINAIWSANDDMSLGALQAIKHAGKAPGKDIYLTGMDLDNEAVQAVADGQMVASLGGHWLEGGFAAGALYDQIKGHPIPKSRSDIRLRLVMVTKRNVAVFRRQYPNGQPASFNFKEHSQVYNKNAGPVDYKLPEIG